MMNTSSLIIHSFQESPIIFTQSGWINATKTCETLQRQGLDNFLRSKRFRDYGQALAENLKYVNFTDLKSTQKGRQGGTFLHPKLAIEFARWISPQFAVWCDERIAEILQKQNLGEVTRQYRQKLQTIEERQLIQEQKFNELEKERQEAKAELESFGSEPIRTHIIGARKEVDTLVRAYSTHKNIPAPDVYRKLYRRFTLKFHTNVYMRAKKVKMSPMVWIEENGWMIQLLDVTREMLR